MAREGIEGGGAVFAAAAPRLTKRDAARLAIDGAAWFVGMFFAALARYDFSPSKVDVRGVFAFAAAAVVLQWLIGTSLYLYRGRYRYGSFDEVSGVATTVLIVGAILTAFDYLVFRNRSVPASAPIMGAFIALVLMLAVRYVRRFTLERSHRPDLETATKVLVFGAGNAGSQLVQSMMRDPGSQYMPVGLLDDDPRWRNLRVSGVKMLGTRSAIPAAAKSTGATVLVVAIARADAALLRDINGIATEAGLTVKVIPTVGELMDGKVTSADVRDINEADLLGRHQIETDLDSDRPLPDRAGACW